MITGATKERVTAINQRIAAGLPEDWTAESMMSPHKSMPYSPTIAKVFYRMGYIEKIVAACDRLGAPRPEYEVVDYSITPRLHALESAIIGSAKGSNEPVEDLGNSKTASLKDQNDTLDDTLGMSSDAIARSVLDAIRQNPSLRQTELAEELGVSLPTIKRTIKRLCSLGLLRGVGGKRYGHWEVAE